MTSKPPLDRVWYFLQQWDQGEVLAKAGHVPLNYDDVGSLAEAVKASQADAADRTDLVPVVLVPVEVFGGECACHEEAQVHDRQGDCGDCGGWGYGLMDAVQGWSDCNRAVGRIYRAEDLAAPGEDPARYRKPGEVLTVQVPRDQAAWFERKWGDEAGGRDSVAYIRGEVVPAEVPPLAELVTDEDVQVAWQRYFDADGLVDAGTPAAMRAALEAYGARLLARHGRTP